ncbi:MAG: hypothetical protein ABIN67_04140 [Ferruginibacter sp.]
MNTKHKFIYFPYPMDSKWRSSIGINLTTMPEDITEEFHYRIPAIDYHVNRKITNKIYLDGHVAVQILQNMITIGPRWATALSDRLSFSAGNDIGWWFGFVNVEGFKSRGNGWQNYPNASLGYRFQKNLFLSFKAEAIMNLGVQTHTGDVSVKSDERLFSGGSVTIALEQPFYKQKSLTLGFRAIYTNFYWQTWSLFENFDRNIFYPQIIIGLIL